MEIDEFKKKHKIQKKRKSNLEKYKSKILQLWEEDISLKNIQLFLIENGVKTSFQNISKFIRAETQNQTSQTLVNKTKPSTKTQNGTIENKQKITSKSKEEVKKALEDMDVFFPRNREN